MGLPTLIRRMTARSGPGEKMGQSYRGNSTTTFGFHFERVKTRKLRCVTLLAAAETSKEVQKQALYTIATVGFMVA